MNNPLIWPNKLVAPVIITYNRSAWLRKTLQAFLDAGLISMELTVLDNASTDDTREVVEEFRQQWPSISYRRNPYNIGGNPNYLRAIEAGSSVYCWIIGDDDEWHLDDLEELVSVLHKGEADVVRLGWLAKPDERGKLLPLADLVGGNSLLFTSVSMISSVIVRRALIVRYLPEAYLAAGDAYPQLMPFFRECSSMSLLVYTLSKDIIRHTPNPDPGYYMGDLEWIACYCRNSRFIIGIEERRKYVSELMEYLRENLKIKRKVCFTLRLLLYYALKSKAYRIKQGEYLFTLLVYGCGIRSAVFMAALLYNVIPNFVLRPFVRAARLRIGLSGDLDKVKDLFLEGRRNRL